MRKLVVLLSLLGAERAHACGCFAPPDPTVPVIQAGELIAFAAHDGQIDAHIQIRYSGAAADFGWLLPLPSEPTLELGSDELFAKLEEATRPRWQLTQISDGTCNYYGSPDLEFRAASDLGAAGPSSP